MKISEFRKRSYMVSTQTRATTRRGNVISWKRGRATSTTMPSSLRGIPSRGALHRVDGVAAQPLQNCRFGRRRLEQLLDHRRPAPQPPRRRAQNAASSARTARCLTGIVVGQAVLGTRNALIAGRTRGTTAGTSAKSRTTPNVGGRTATRRAILEEA